MKTQKLKSLCFGLAMLISATLFAGVNLKNGNFYISYTDIIVPGDGPDLEVTRTYNSKSTHVGWFGFGWGSPYETYLTTDLDGAVTIHENGAGALTRFTPKGRLVKKSARKAAKQILAAMREKSPMSKRAAKKLLNDLIHSSELRRGHARRFGVKTALPKGTVLYSSTRGIQTVHVLENGYQRKYSDGKIEYFDKEGRLIRIYDKKKNYTLFFNYRGKRLLSLKDSLGKQLFFNWYASGRVKSISSGKGKKAQYKYAQDSLIESLDIALNRFQYGYDDNHNLISIKYSDKSQMKISYTNKTQFVKEIIDRKGRKFEYSYGAHSKNPKLNYWTTVTRSGASGKKRMSRYDYEIKIRPDGSRYTHRTLVKQNGVTTETTYSQCCSLPLKIKRGKEVTTFEYTSKGLLKKKVSTRGERVELEYHKKFNKVTKVSNPKGWTQFEYDSRGYLAKAWNSKGERVALVQNFKGQVTKMIYKKRATKSLASKNKFEEKKVIHFSYNSLGKPVEIVIERLGTVNIAYDNNGEVKKVESKKGPKMALHLTQTFQALFSIVKPAGVSLNI